MGCCLGAILGLLTPRFVLLVLWLFTDYLSRAFHSFIWPFLGFFFLPTTTLAYAVAENELHGLQGWGLALVIVGVIFDLGLMGGGARSRARRR